MLRRLNPVTDPRTAILYIFLAFFIIELLILLWDTYQGSVSDTLLKSILEALAFAYSAPLAIILGSIFAKQPQASTPTVQFAASIALVLLWNVVVAIPIAMFNLTGNPDAAGIGPWFDDLPKKVQFLLDGVLAYYFVKT